MRRPQMEAQSAPVAPALQLNHPVALPHRMAFHKRQPAGFGEQVDQHHRLVVHFEIVRLDNFTECAVTDIGPGR